VDVSQPNIETKAKQPIKVCFALVINQWNRTNSLCIIDRKYEYLIYSKIVNSVGEPLIKWHQLIYVFDESSSID
jgi:hypothetical protein